MKRFVLIIKKEETGELPLTLSAPMEEKPREVTWCLSVSQKESQHLGLGLPSLQNSEKTNAHWLSHAVNEIFLL